MEGMDTIVKGDAGVPAGGTTASQTEAKEDKDSKASVPTARSRTSSVESKEATEPSLTGTQKETESKFEGINGPNIDAPKDPKVDVQEGSEVHKSEEYPQSPMSGTKKGVKGPQVERNDEVEVRSPGTNPSVPKHQEQGPMAELSQASPSSDSEPLPAERRLSPPQPLEDGPNPEPPLHPEPQLDFGPEPDFDLEPELEPEPDSEPEQATQPEPNIEPEDDTDLEEEGFEGDFEQDPETETEPELVDPEAEFEPLPNDQGVV